MNRLVVIVALLACVLGALFLYVRFFVFGYYVIPQNGMYPTLPAGSRLFANKYAYSSIADIRRGDVILFWRAQDSRRYLYVWRVVGLPGDQVSVRGEDVVINGVALQKTRRHEQDGFVIYTETNGDAQYRVAYQINPRSLPMNIESSQVPRDAVFVLGDNRYNALDSRALGAVGFKDIIGRKM